jgi:S-DNA-T family DNA segregation ATPase FtsK/SpoIIIE
VVITAIALRRSPLHEAPEVKRLVTSADGLDAALAAALEDRAPQLVLVDDADGVDDTMGAIAALMGKGRPDLHLVVAARPDSLRNNYLHWTTAIRNSRQGLALRPNIDQDGNLWNLFLPRSGPTTFGPGRGYLIAEGQPELLQAARR